MAKPTIAFINGSLRRYSFHDRLGKAVIAASASRLDYRPVAVGDLPLYNQDLEDADAPKAWSDFRDEIRGVDGILFASPEYNRSTTGALKNAIDVGSRPVGKSVWAKKAVGIFSASPGAVGGFGSNHHLRQSCVTLNMIAMAQPEAYWGGISDDKIALDGTIHDDGLRKVVTGFARAFADWVDFVRGGE